MGMKIEAWSEAGEVRRADGADLAQVPAERAKGAREVVDFGELRRARARVRKRRGATTGTGGSIRMRGKRALRARDLVALVEDDEQLVLHAAQCRGQALERLARRSRLVGVEEQEDDVRVLCKPLDYVHEVEPAVVDLGRPLVLVLLAVEPQSIVDCDMRLRCGDGWAINHARGVHKYDIVQSHSFPHFQVDVRDQRRTFVPQRHEAQIGISNQGRAILISVFSTRGDQSEAVVSRRNSTFLNVRAQKVIDKSRLPRRVISQQQNHRTRCYCFRLWQWSEHTLVDWQQHALVALIRFGFQPFHQEWIGRTQA